MAINMRQILYKWEFWIGHNKKPKKWTAYKHIESNYHNESFLVDETILYDHIPQVIKIY